MRPFCFPATMDGGTVADGVLTPNPDASLYVQQDKLLSSWLLSTISSSLLSFFIDAKSAYEVWSTTNRLFPVATGAKLSSIKHDLHSIKKGTISMKEYVAKIQNTCALLEASGFAVPKVEKVEIILASLLSDYNAILTLALFSTEPLPLKKLINMLLEFENRQARMVHDELFHVNLVAVAPTAPVMNSVHGDRSFFPTRRGPSALAPTMVPVFAGCTDQRSHDGGTSDSSLCPSVRGNPTGFVGSEMYLGSTVVAPVDTLYGAAWRGQPCNGYLSNLSAARRDLGNHSQPGLPRDLGLQYGSNVYPNVIPNRPFASNRKYEPYNRPTP
ncbi:hypothetical protein PVK06_048526 [Gossypium arboreum]|uniref:Retrovirus-related Pol polyprotein from transposon TNT 1-94 n=1 Tax=Gossypium arboreum TaxID=29729 RepID=A0ABR0MG55_GOSAR|nr:hypothetical protein PVK06_048526 [Gossypium arboreum]